MKFPIVFRCDHEEIVNELKADKAALEHENKWLTDFIWKHNFNAQIFNTITDPAAVPDPAPEPEAAEDPAEAERSRSAARLSSLARTRPSQLGAAMEQEMHRSALRRAHSAHPPMTVTPAMELFSKAKQEALS